VGNTVRVLRPDNQPVLVTAVVDAASESAVPITPGKITVIYGAGLGPTALIQNAPANGAFGSQVGGTTVSFNGTPAPIIYSLQSQVAVIVPYEVAGSSSAQVTVTSSAGVSAPFTVQVASTAPSFFSATGTGAGQVAAVNADGSFNGPLYPTAIGGYISLFVTGEGQVSPSGVDGALALTSPYPKPLQPVTITIGGVNAPPVYAGTAPTEVEGLMQVVVQIPQGVTPGGYVPVDISVGAASSVHGAAWIAVSAN
jgi:uncharacterized protein (TIGR03437 family)